MKTTGYNTSMIMVSLVLFHLTIISYGADCGGLVECACGDTLVESQVMWYDIVDCAAAWTLRIGADDITLDGDGHTIDGDTQFNIIQMGAKSGVTIQNCIIQDGQDGIYMYTDCNNNTIHSNQFYNNEKAIQMNVTCRYNIISDNLIDNNLQGIRFDWGSNNNTCFGNTISRCNYGIYHYNSQGNTFYDNVFVNNTYYNAFEDSDSNGNFWNLGTVGNYWDDMTSNAGYPDNYEIDGPGDGIDGYPISAAVEVDPFDHSKAQIELVMFDGSSEIIDMTGTSTMEVYFEGPTEGSAFDDDGDNLDDVQTEMTALNLTGTSSMGPVFMRLRASLPTVGEMEEIANNTPGTLDVRPFSSNGTVDSFFDVYVELEIPAMSMTLHTAGPVRWSSLLSHKPPAPTDIYEGTEPVELYDAAGQATGLFLGGTNYQPNPVVEIDQFDHSRSQIELVMPIVGSELIELAGTSTMKVYFEDATEGSAFDDDGDNRDEVQTEIVVLDLFGTSSILGVIYMRPRASLPTVGEMEETVNNTPGTLDVRPFSSNGMVDSFFDVYVELEIPAMSMTLHTAGPVQWSSLLGHKPPGPTDIYESLQPVELLDAAGQATGFILEEINYHPNPCVRCSDFDESGTSNMPDLLEFVSNWSWIESVGDTSNQADLNCDWKVNYFDFVEFATSWLQACP